MNAFFSSAAVKLNPLIGLVITVAGALIGGKLAGDAPLGMLLGIVAGSAVALGLCGAIAMLGMVVDAIEQPSAAQATGPVAHAAAAHTAPDINATQAAIRAAAAGTANGVANGAEAAALAGSTDADMEQLMARGQFSEYHLIKARRALAEGNFKDAAYQAAASLSHNPGNAEARAVRTAAKKKR